MTNLRVTTTEGEIEVYSIDDGESELFLPFHHIETIDL